MTQLAGLASAMKIAFLTASTEDYLSDGVLHGLRQLLGENVVDSPRAERLYADCPPEVKRHLRGGGFTLYGLLPNLEIDRHYLRSRMEQGEFDLVVFGNIYNDFGAYVELAAKLDPRRMAVLDGSDWEAMYPYAGNWWKHLSLWFLPRANRPLYFKRELTPRTLHYRSYRLLPEWLCRRLGPPRNVRPLAFSIPAEKVVQDLPVKEKLFATHVVDPEVASRLEGSRTAGAFATEAEYYADLQRSRFAITTKRAGWDCLRHYEIAANGCVMCFRDLDRKPATCAPHGLCAENCIVYHGYDDLMRQIDGMSDETYGQLQAASLRWANQNTTVARARELLDTVAKG